MNTATAFAATAAAIATAAGVAAAQTPAPATPTLETFDTGLNGFIAPPPGADPTATVVTEGGNSFARVTREVPAGGGGGFGAFTALANNTPGNDFAGDFTAGGITQFSFDVRHDADIPLGFSGRLATPFNFPGVALINPAIVPAGPDFTTITFTLDPASPFVIDEGGGDPAVTLSNIQNIQLLVDNPDTAPSGPVTFDFDNVRTVPAPGAVALAGVAGLAATRRRR